MPSDFPKKRRNRRTIIIGGACCRACSPQRFCGRSEIRGFLIERGITVRQGPAPLRKALPEILSSPTEVLSPRLTHLLFEYVIDAIRRGMLQGLPDDVLMPSSPGSA